MFWEDQTAVLERVVAGHPLAEILADIVRMIERQADGMMCSLLLLDDDRRRIRHGATASLPAAYARLLDGQEIGPSAGSCGAAAFHKERVIVEDIATHPYWDGYRDLALPFGLRACWSTPVLSAEREVLGTFAMYYREPRAPSDHELAWVDAATHLAAIAIVSDRAATALRRSEARAQRLARLYAMSNAINEAMVRERDVRRLYDRACEIAVDHAMARLAWIGIVDDARRIVPLAQAGATGYLAAINLDLGDERMNRGPAAQALRDDRHAVCNDIANDPDFHWKAVAEAHHLRACAVFPMRYRARTTGVLVIYTEQTQAFGPEELAVLTRLADDISFAVDAIHTEAALRQSEERLRAVIEHTPDVAIQWYDEAGRVIFVNQASCRMFGWTADDALGKTLLELEFWRRGEEDRFAALRRAAATGQPVAPTQFAFRRGDGSDGVLLSTVFRIPLSETEHGYVCMDLDLTEHRRMEAAVHAGENLRSLIYDLVADAVFYIAIEGAGQYRFQSVNRAFLEATGLADHEVVGHLIDDVIPAPSLALVKAKYAEAVATLHKVEWEEVSTYRVGVRRGEVTVCPVRDGAGRCTHLVGTVHDTTARHTVELERRQIEAQLHQAQRLQALGTLAGGIAHDFNNILAAIHGNVELAMEDVGVRHAAYGDLLEVKRAARRATDLVRQILAFGRKTEPRRERIELRAVIEEALGLLRVGFKGALRLATAFDPSTPSIHGDSTQIHQVIMNLVTNAMQAIGDAGGAIEVKLDACTITTARSDAPELVEGSYARLTVTDTGCGMDEATLRRAFEPFFTTKPVGDGTGLGLSVVHGIMRGHGGAVTVRSEVDRGTTFELWFPAAAATDPATAAPSAPEHRRQHVLFVDDDDALVFLARRAFSRLGHQVSAYISSREALRDYRRNPAEFDVVIADIAMPGLDGPALVREVRQIAPHAKIVLTSGCIRPEHLEIARELGVDQLLEKPQSLDDLAKLVAPLLSGPATS